MSTIIQFRRGTAAEWTAANTILANGEKGLETDGLGTTEVKEKIGNGVLAWNDLPYQESGAVASVSGDGVNNTDPKNPVLSFPTPTEINLGNVDNTSDANKPVSTAQQTALDLKVAIATNPSKTVKGAIKAFYDVATSTLEISIDGVDIP